MFSSRFWSSSGLCPHLSSPELAGKTPAWPSLYYAGIRLLAIYVVHDGRHVRLSNHGGMDCCRVLVGQLATPQVWPWPVTEFTGHRCRRHCFFFDSWSSLEETSERQGYCCHSSMNHSSASTHHSVTLLVNNKEQVVGDFKLHRKIQKNSDMLVE